MKVRIESNYFDETSRCQLCASVFYPREAIARAYEESGEYLTDVCPACIAAGAEGIRKRLQNHANSLRLQAHKLERLAQEEILVPTTAEFSLMVQLAEALR